MLLHLGALEVGLLELLELVDPEQTGDVLDFGRVDVADDVVRVLARVDFVLRDHTHDAHVLPAGREVVFEFEDEAVVAHVFVLLAVVNELDFQGRFAGVEDVHGLLEVAVEDVDRLADALDVLAGF